MVTELLAFIHGGWGLVLLQVCIILACGITLSYAPRVRPARAHALLVLAAAACIAMPILSLSAKTLNWGMVRLERPTHATSDTNDLEGFTAGPGTPPVVITPASEPATGTAAPLVAAAPAVKPWRFEWRVAAAAAWLIASSLCVAAMLWRLIAARRLLAGARPVEPAIRQLVDRVRSRVAMVRLVRTVQLDEARCPAIWCWSKEPTLILPTTGLGRNEPAGVVGHELAHALRRDHVWSLLMDVLCCAMPWNPLAWWARRRAGALSELACDAWAIKAADGAPAEYADALLALVPHRRPALALGAVGGKSALAARIRTILCTQRSRPEAGGLWTLAAATIAIAAAASVALAQPRKEPPPEPEAAQPVAPEQPTTPPQNTASTDDLTASLLAADKDGWRAAFATGQRLASLEGDAGYEVVKAAWPKLTPSTKAQLQKAWVFKSQEGSTPHPRLLDVLNLGMTDEALEAQKFALTYLTSIAFQDFAQDIEAYRSWHAANGSKKPELAMTDSLKGWLSRLRSGNVTRRAAALAIQREALTSIRRSPLLQKAAAEVGAAETALELMKLDKSPEATMVALELMGVINADESFVRQHLFPHLKSADDQVRAKAVGALAKQAWAFDTLHTMLRDEYLASGPKTSTFRALVAALTEHSNPRVIPLMIAIIDSHDGYDTVYGVGYFGLGRLTGVKYDKAHDGVWWSNWWEQNKTRFPADVQAMKIPDLGKAPAPEIAPEDGPDAPRENAPPRNNRERAMDEANEESRRQQEARIEAASMPSTKVLVGNDPNKHYELMGPREGEKEPEGGWKLLVILPGGDGSADFNPFLRRVALKALPPGYMVAQAVAPKWTDNQNRVVWPTAKLPDGKMGFPTEQFVREVIADVKLRKTIDAGRVYLMGWSSGGPPVYTCLTMPDMPVAGAFVAMSVFKPDVLPALEGAKDRAVYVLHSPQDTINIRFANDAVAKLAAAGARTKLATYEGGHGWRGDVFGQIRAGIEWLEQK
jgi:beta-lactamase regulating signal transducer with metallopeptidase domain/poly(3-hydroxybutyrate) depolymerase